MKQPFVMIFAGPNGIGKTTFARKYLESIVGNIEFLNVDDYTANNPRAARQYFERIDTLISESRSFATESTLSGRSLLVRIASWRASGYSIRIIFLWGAALEETKRRIERRVAEGGHDIPDHVVDRRFDRSYWNFLEF
ncbi:MAG: Zeta toxin family protein [Ignavibacteriae bacterium]|nr:MAG: Zeta toxin family protein [Ignavibacteriota bacterium]